MKNKFFIKSSKCRVTIILSLKTKTNLVIMLQAEVESIHGASRRRRDETRL